MSDNSINNLKPPNIAIQEDDLHKAGFTSSGIKKYKETIQDLANELFNKAVLHGEVSKGVGLPREVTHEHVRNATSNILQAFGKSKKPTGLIIAQVAEYVFTGMAGIGGGHLKDWWGVLMFGVALSIAVILIVYRLIKSPRD